MCSHQGFGVAPRVYNQSTPAHTGIDPWRLVYDIHLLPSRSQWPLLKGDAFIESWDYLFLPEWAHGFLKWGSQVGFAQTWQDLWLAGIGQALVNQNNLHQVDWQNPAIRKFHLQGCQRAALLKIFAEKIPSSFPLEGKIHLALATIRQTAKHLISHEQPLTELVLSNSSRTISGQKAILLGIEDSDIGVKSLTSPWDAVLALTQTWVHRSFTDRFSTRDVEQLARELGRLPLKWDPSFLDEIVASLRSKYPKTNLSKPWQPKEIALLNLGNSLTVRARPDISQAIKPSIGSLNQEMDPSARIQLAEMAAGAGHEINNPLAIITGTVQRLQKMWDSEKPQADDKNPQKSLELILRQVQRVRNQIDELMWFSRPPEPRLSPRSFSELKAIWKTGITGSCLSEESNSLPKRKGQGKILALDPVQFGRIARLVGEFFRHHLPKGNEQSLEYSFHRKGKTLVAIAKGLLPIWSPSQILGIFTPFFCPKGFGRTSGLQLPAARALAEKCGWALSLVQGAKESPGQILLEIPIIAAEPAKTVSKPKLRSKSIQGCQKMALRPVA